MPLNSSVGRIQLRSSSENPASPWYANLFGDVRGNLAPPPLRHPAIEQAQQSELGLDPGPVGTDGVHKACVGQPPLRRDHGRDDGIRHAADRKIQIDDGGMLSSEIYPLPVSTDAGRVRQG